MRKAVKDQIYHFVWNPSEPYAPTPSLTVKFASGDYTANFVQSRADVAVTSIANDRRTLTLSGAVGASLERDEVKAFLRTTRDTWYSVTVSRIGGTTAVLAEPLPREIDLSSSATLNFAMSYIDVPAGQTAINGLYPFTIAYESAVGGRHVETGILKVTPRPFDTGLSHDELVSQIANLADMIPRRQSDFKPQILAALDDIALIVRDRVISDGVTEDEVFNQQAFKRAHAYCTAALIYEMNMQFDAATAMREQCDDRLDIALRSVDIDLDGDGVVDPEEENLRRSGGNKNDFRASFKSYIKSTNDSFFDPSRGQRH
ncbi:hypothetical protein [uncultured Idiomarina sp.]|uniref:hypothetical protein n=1 Tax=uncultured Idiomarina sp. TaxID=352961 RepID=UPI0032B13745|tara:strand:- start:4286 stop:5233 length:948 start_codon:yes stop_codon:yes gene_type:complete